MFSTIYSPKGLQRTKRLSGTHAQFEPRQFLHSHRQWAELSFTEKVAFLVTFYGIIKSLFTPSVLHGPFGLLFGAFVSRPLRPFLLRVQWPFLSLQDSAFFLICLVLAACAGLMMLWPTLADEYLSASSSLSFLSHHITSHWRPGTLSGW